MLTLNVSCLLRHLIRGSPALSSPSHLGYKHCGKPGQIEGATLQGVWNAESYAPGSVATFSCTNGYTLEGSIKMVCIEGSWIDVSKRQCKVLGHCSKPQQSHENGELQGQWNDETFPPGKVATYICHQGYSQTSPIKMACIEGEWIPISKGQCIAVLGHCSKPQQSHENRELQGQWNDETFPPGKVATYICRQGYSQTGPIKMACIEDEWIPISKGQCIAEIVCYQETVENGIGRFLKETYREGETIELVCNEGYTIEHNPEEPRKCTSRGWNPPLKCKNSSCTEPPKVQNGETKGQKKPIYLSGESVTYECLPGFTMGQNAKYITCKNSAWTEPPKCRRIGQSCTRPPVIQNGDTIELKRLSYPSGTSVTYRCANYYKLEGQETITCRDGEWEKEPICRVPCTSRDIDMQQNNIRFRFRTNRKLYSEHADFMSFVCIQGYEISNKESLRVQCLDGVIKYPKCRKEGFCVLQQKDMFQNNIQYNKSNEIENGETIEFKCVEGMVPENGLKATCSNSQINYPKCSTGPSSG